MTARRAAVVALVAAALLAAYWLTLPDAPPEPVRPPAPPVDAAPPDARVVDAAPAPPVDASPLPPIDASPPPSPAEAEDAARTGLIGRPAGWIAHLPPVGWTPSADGRRWTSPRGTDVEFAVRDGRVTGVRVRFETGAFSAAVSELSNPLIGHRGGGGPMLPGGEQAESMTLDPAVRTGTVEGADGRPLEWRLWLRTTGEPPYGPARFELGDLR